MEMAETMEQTPEVGLKLESASWRESAKAWLPILGIIGCGLFFHWWSEGSFLTARNLSNLSRQVCVNLTLAVGMTMVILTSGIDLSVGSVLALSGMVAAITQVHFGWAELGRWGAFLSFVAALGVGGLCGALTGWSVSRLKITPFIISLGMMVICRGLTLIVSGAQAVAPLGASLGTLSADYLPIFPSAILIGFITIALIVRKAREWSKGDSTRDSCLAASSQILLFSGVAAFVFVGYRGIPYMVFFAVACAVCGMFALKYLRFGRFLYAIGGNREAAELSGVPVAKTLLVTYFLMGCLAGLAGVLDTARVNGAVPSAGELAELDAIAAVVIGGTSLMGGVGTIAGTLFGVLIMGILNNGMSLVGISEHYQKVFKGLVIILAVYFDMRAKKK